MADTKKVAGVGAAAVAAGLMAVKLFMGGETMQLPDHKLTPGEWEERPLWDEDGDSVLNRLPEKFKAPIWQKHGIPFESRTNYALNFLIPVQLGGQMSPDNVWPVPKSSIQAKREIDAELVRRVKERHRAKSMIDDDAAVREMRAEVSTNWISARKKYLNK